MTGNQIQELMRRIAELESEVRDRESDLARFRLELSGANSQLESLIAQLQVELKMIHNIQRNLVPTEIPHIPGFDFSTKFIPSLVSGGDYFDIFEHEDRFRFGTILASSSGHAMSALFLSVLLKFSGQLEARKGAEPSRILELILGEIVPAMQEGSRADLFYGVIDRRNFELKYSLVGKLHGFWQPYGGKELRLLEASAAEVRPKESPTKIESKGALLNPRDRLIICTRGVSEVKNLKGEEFGVARLSKIILEGPQAGVHELRNHILFEVQKFLGGQELQRDQTVLVLEVKERILKLAKK